MKFNISDDTGSHLVAVLKLDGSPAIEGEDFVKWEGDFHKNGRWSYTEGGVALKEGIIIIHHRSTHYGNDHTNWLHIMKDNKEVDHCYIMGRIEETPQRPQNPSKEINNEVWGKIVDAVVEYYNKKDPSKTKEMLRRWVEIEKFL